MTTTVQREAAPGAYAPPAASASGVQRSAPADRYAHKYLIAIAVTLAAVLELVDTSIVNVAIPHMMGNLGATLDEISWVSTGYIIANVIIIPMSGWLSAYFGRKRYLTGSILLFVASSFMCGAATSLWGLVLWRVVQGIGGGGLLSTAQATLFESFPPEEAGIGQTIFGMGVMVGPTIGPTLGGWIVDNWSWPWIFYINVPLGLIAAVMVFTYVRNAAHQEKADTIDGTGIVLLTLAVGSLQWMLERGERYDWFESRFVTTLAVVSALSFIALVWRELTIDEPVVDFHVLKSRQLAAGVGFAAFLGFALYGSVFVLPVFLQALHGFTANQTGMVILPGALASAFTMAAMAKNSNRIDARVTITIGAGLFLASMYKLSLLSLDAGAHDLFWPLVLRGVALGLIFIPLTNASMNEIPDRMLAQGTGMFNLTRQLGGSLGIAIMATLLSRFTRTQKALLSEHLVPGTPATDERLTMLTRGLMSKGMDAIHANQGALAILDRQLTAQASVLAFSKIYFYSGVTLLCALPLLLFWRTGRATRTGAPSH